MNLGATIGGALTGTLRNDAFPADLASRTAHPPTEVDVVIHAARSGSLVEQGAALRALDRAFGDARLSEALVRADAEPTRGGAAPAAETCTVEVRFKPVIGPTHHAFIVTTDADSTDYFRGGPSSKDIGINSPTTSSGSGDARSEFDPRFGMFGQIVTEHGAYERGTSDWTTAPSARQTVARIDGSCDTINRTLSRHMDDIEAADINYTPLDNNSNSVVREALERAGFGDVEPAIWAPAWYAQLPGPR